ncbi:hypothetical protein PRI8871_00700 [Pseudoprimorskyibacter insulae]|uniref:Uncharacterized protein n=1 Tax=Pseudoprimorskyibacter insulae TaxID=1695997 RepID=A0A2R8AQI8_9RHOB|nr:hypothetical protein PRI8871_00700 [Pseudoprimorskyibacter insulae]
MNCAGTITARLIQTALIPRIACQDRDAPYMLRMMNRWKISRINSMFMHMVCARAGGEPRRVCRRLVAVSYAAKSSLASDA